MGKFVGFIKTQEYLDLLLAWECGYLCVMLPNLARRIVGEIEDDEACRFQRRVRLHVAARLKANGFIGTDGEAAVYPFGRDIREGHGLRAAYVAKEIMWCRLVLAEQSLAWAVHVLDAPPLSTMAENLNGLREVIRGMQHGV